MSLPKPHWNVIVRKVIDLEMDSKLLISRAVRFDRQNNIDELQFFDYNTMRWFHHSISIKLFAPKQ